MKYIIASKEEIEINTGDQVMLIDEYQAKFPGYFEVVEALDTYLVIDFKENGIFGFSPELVASVKRAQAELPADISPQVIAIVQDALPALLDSALQDAIKKQITPEFIDSLLPGAIDKKVKEVIGKALVDSGNALLG